MEYPLHFTDSESFAGKINDISQFLVQHGCPANLQIAPLANKLICVHNPCSLKNIIRADAPPLELVQAIPGATVQPLSEFPHCCGAAGSYMLEHPEMATALCNDLVDAVEAMQPDYLVTSNIGCALHMESEIRQRNLHIEVLHPVALLARQLAEHPD